MKTKDEIFSELLDRRYPGIEELKCDAAYSAEDVMDYINYCDRNPDFKDVSSWKQYRAIKEKARKKGIDSIVYKDYVERIEKVKAWEQANIGDVEVYAVKVTVKHMGTFLVFNGGIIKDV